MFDAELGGSERAESGLPLASNNKALRKKRKPLI